MSAVAAAALFGYAALWVGYRQNWAWLAAADTSALRACHDIGVSHPGWVRFWDGLCTVLAPVTFRALAMLAVAVALARRRFWPALFLLVSVEPSGLVATAAKGLADRPRPAAAMVAATSSSFPSGHALGAMAGVTALLLLPVLRRRGRIAAVAAGAAVVLAVGFGRVALNVHHPSDVLAGWALGFAYVALCARLLRVPARLTEPIPSRKT